MIASHPWYIATTESGMFFSEWQPFTRVRHQFEVLYSRNYFRGFRVFRHPREIADEPYAMGFLPWTIWRVTPRDIISTWELPETVVARRIRIEARLRPGGEFERNGDLIRGFADHVAQLDPWPQPLESNRQRSPDVWNALIDLENATVRALGHSPFDTDRVFAWRYLRRRTVAAKYSDVGDRELRSQIDSAERELRAISAAFVADIRVPRVFAQRWHVPSALLYGFRRDENLAVSQ